MGSLTLHDVASGIVILSLSLSTWPDFQANPIFSPTRSPVPPAMALGGGGGGRGGGGAGGGAGVGGGGGGNGRSPGVARRHKPATAAAINTAATTASAASAASTASTAPTAKTAATDSNAAATAAGTLAAAAAAIAASAEAAAAAVTAAAAATAAAATATQPIEDDDDLNCETESENSFADESREFETASLSSWSDSEISDCPISPPAAAARRSPRSHGGGGSGGGSGGGGGGVVGGSGGGGSGDGGVTNSVDTSAEASDPTKGVTQLHVATHYGKLDAMRSLLSKGHAVDATAANAVTPLHIAAKVWQCYLIPVLKVPGFNGSTLGTKTSSTAFKFCFQLQVAPVRYGGQCGCRAPAAVARRRWGSTPYCAGARHAIRCISV